MKKPKLKDSIYYKTCKNDESPLSPAFDKMSEGKARRTSGGGISLGRGGVTLAIVKMDHGHVQIILSVHISHIGLGALLLRYFARKKNGFDESMLVDI